MFEVFQNIVKISRGNFAEMDVILNAKDGTPYELVPGDVIVFALKKNVNDAVELKHKEFTEKKVVFEPEDTLDLPFGEYVYDLTLLRANNLKPNTFVGPSAFHVLEVVRNGR